MKNFKKLLAMLLVLVMALTMLTACKDEEENNDVNDTNVTETAEIGVYDGDKKLLGASDTFMTINGYEIPYDEFRYMYMYLDLNYFSGGDDAYWEQYPEMHDTLLEYAKSYVLESNWGNIMAAQNNLSLNDEDLAAIDSYMAEQVSYFESQEQYEEALEASGITEDLLKRLVTQELYCNRVFEDLYVAEGAPNHLSDEEIIASLSQDYRRVYHTLISFDHYKDLEGYEDATEEELKAAALQLANQTLEMIQNGDITVYEHAQSDGDDPGMLDNEEGYFFTYGEMVEEFEKKSFELEVGEISGLVETSYGYHIIERLEQEAYIVSHQETLEETVYNSLLNKDVNALLENATVEFFEGYENIDHTSIR